MSHPLPFALPSDASSLPETDASEPAEVRELRETLKRCSPETLAAAIAFRQTGNLEHVRPVVTGIIERFVERDLRCRLECPAPDLRLTEDLGIDSLSLMEVVLLTEDVLRITIDNEELRNLRTLGNVHHYVDQKLRGAPAADSVGGQGGSAHQPGDTR